MSDLCVPVLQGLTLYYPSIEGFDLVFTCTPCVARWTNSSSRKTRLPAYSRLSRNAPGSGWSSRPLSKAPGQHYKQNPITLIDLTVQKHIVRNTYCIIYIYLEERMKWRVLVVCSARHRIVENFRTLILPNLEYHENHFTLLGV